jgi:Ni,Fe-hydrogenase I large subunit
VAARGLLLHRVTLQAGQISDYRILAPTEWNFHPQGVVAQALGSLRGDPEWVERAAGQLIEAIDPCVGYSLSIKRTTV